MKFPIFDRLNMGFMSLAGKIFCELFVDTVSQANSMEFLDEYHARFRNFPMAIEAVAVTFQQSNRPSGTKGHGSRSPCAGAF